MMNLGALLEPGRGAISGKTPKNFEVFYQKVRYFIGLLNVEAIPPLKFSNVFSWQENQRHQKEFSNREIRCIPVASEKV